LHAVRGMGFLVYRPGYRVGWYEAGVEGRNSRVRAWVEGGRLRVEVRLERLDDLDPRRWEGHLATMAYATEYGNPLPEELLLDEAYRYVSQGGEVTEGMLMALDRWLPAGPPIYGQTRDKRMRVVEKEVLEYCVAHGDTSVFCSRRPYLIENYSKALGISERGRQR